MPVTIKGGVHFENAGGLVEATTSIVAAKHLLNIQKQNRIALLVNARSSF